MTQLLTSPEFISLAAIIGGILMPIAIVGIVFWYKARDRELRVHQEMRVREMEHQRKLKELELEIERIKAGQSSSRVA